VERLEAQQQQIDALLKLFEAPEGTRHAVRTDQPK